MPNRELTDGSTAIVRGALAGGCDFFAGYPITPASLILDLMLREMPKVGGVGIQGEDEIASIGMCIGAAMAGARAMTATSGPGISLYSENLGLAIMGEVPLVIVDVQRLGPATGGATTVGQGDIQFVRWGTAGGYPIIALAPSSIPECYSLTRRAFQLARRFRCPVFVVADKELSLTSNTVDVGEEPEPEREVGPQVNGEPDGGPFRAYRYDPADGVPPLAPYGDGQLLRFTGSTHDERAFITKDSQTVDRLNRHLSAKIEEHRDEIDLVTADLEPDAATLFLSFGVTAGAMREAVTTARASGRKVSALTVHSLWPVPETPIRKALEGVQGVIVAELNQGQYRREIERLAAGCQVLGLNRNDGELISPAQFVEML
ncbi:MAG: pyruvate flavodoxin/ferredoxin oxidoreductase [Gemmatimonadetes bacterium]|nr:pyruvate flavodoxin/ferredoxin oxidoreductase [Gemmatimonadota bacterium]